MFGCEWIAEEDYGYIIYTYPYFTSSAKWDELTQGYWPQFTRPEDFDGDQ